MRSGMRPHIDASSNRARCPGMTLVELTIYLGLAALIGGALIGVFTESSRWAAEGFASEKVAGTARVVLFRLSQDLRCAIGGTLAVLSDGKVLRFQLPLGYNDKGVLPGDTIEYEILAATMVGDGGDLLVRRNLKTVDSTVIAAGLCRSGSSFSMIDDRTVTATVTTTSRVVQGGVVATIGTTKSINVNLRN